MQNKEVHELCVKCNHPVNLHNSIGCTAQIRNGQGGKEIEYCNCTVEAGVS
ncbi:MAG: hypothetical protein R3327_06860 [Nitrosopumilaceae archaeon]|nr:hypothetical protein [Nitrosopumilaceae archaeon]